MRRSVALAALLALPALAAPLGAQDKPAPAARPPAPAAAQQKERPFPPVSETVDVTVTNVDVIVTDSKGKRVAGLKPEDFDVRQDGIPQTITNFYAVAGGKLILEDGKTVPLDTKEAVSDVPPEIKAHYVFYVDNLNIQPLNRNRMFKRLKEFIPQAIGPNAEGMVVTFNRSVKIRKGFTSEPIEIVGAIEDIERDTGGGTSTAGERKDAIRRINESKSSSEAQGIAQNYTRALQNDLTFTVDAIQSTINSLAGLQGRKNFVYVSEGLPATAGLEMYEAIREKFQDPSASMQAFEFDMNTKYVGIVHDANANGVTIYTLDASGLTTADLVSADTRAMGSQGQSDVRPNEFFTRQNMQGPIRMLAEQTGGVSAINTNDWKASLDEIGADFSNFYSLGYRSAKGASDRPHSIEVAVKKKGMNVRTRTSYVEKSVETRTAEAVLASLHYPRTDNPLSISVSLGEAKPYDRENYLLPVRVSVPIGKLGLLPSGDLYEGHFFIYFVVLDVSGKQSDLQIQRQEVKVPSKDLTAAQRKDFYFDVKLIVVPGGQKLAVGVRDGVSNLTSYLQKNIFVSVLPKEKPPESTAKPGV